MPYGPQAGGSQQWGTGGDLLPAEPRTAPQHTLLTLCWGVGVFFELSCRQDSAHTEAEGFCLGVFSSTEPWGPRQGKIPAGR